MNFFSGLAERVLGLSPKRTGTKVMTERSWNGDQNVLNDFLRERKERFLANLGNIESRTSEWTVVTGNEAGGTYLQWSNK
jgi:hypothetical protein